MSSTVPIASGSFGDENGSIFQVSGLRAV
jgi:hypothetical protein